MYYLQPRGSLALLVAVIATGGFALAVVPAPPLRAAEDLSHIDISNGCTSLECHGGMLSRRYVHTAVQMEACEACHLPTNSTHEFDPVPDVPDLCFACHDAFPEDQGIHGIVEAGACDACHDPHGGAGKGNVIEANVGDLCAACHGDPAEEFPYQHGPARDGECTECHKPHTSEHDSLLKAGQPDLCLACHQKRKRRQDGTFTRAIGEAIEALPNVHPPVEECVLCHGPHGGISQPSLAQPFPSDMYAAFSEDTYELCFLCHDAAPFEEEDNTDTQFRNGTRSLHYVHVNKEKGRTCRFCHDPHATTLPHMLRDSVPFGDWEFPLRYEETETGGGCWPGCHNELTYDRGTDATALLGTPQIMHTPIATDAQQLGSGPPPA